MLYLHYVIQKLCHKIRQHPDIILKTENFAGGLITKLSCNLLGAFADILH